MKTISVALILMLLLGCTHVQLSPQSAGSSKVDRLPLLSGSGAGDSQSIELAKRSRIRLQWTGVAQAHLKRIKDGRSENSFVINSTEKQTGETSVWVDAGEYYFDVFAYEDTGWQIEVSKSGG